LFLFLLIVIGLVVVGIPPCIVIYMVLVVLLGLVVLIVHGFHRNVISARLGLTEHLLDDASCFSSVNLSGFVPGNCFPTHRGECRLWINEAKKQLTAHHQLLNSYYWALFLVPRMYRVTWKLYTVHYIMCTVYSVQFLAIKVKKWFNALVGRHAKCHSHRNHRLCEIFMAWVNFKIKHTLFCHQFNLWSIFCSSSWVRVTGNARQ
jgi:hypothetical protein